MNQQAGLPGALPGPSASGARLTGDDLQHLVAWYWALCSLRPEQAIISVAVEALHAGNVDDMVVTRRVGPVDHYQIKAVVAAREMVSSAWLLAPTRRGGPSILQKFWQSWNQLRIGGRHVRLTLLTNRPLDVTDPVLQGRDRNDCLAAALRRAQGRSAAGQARRVWAEHLDASEEELCRFLDDLRVRTDASEATWRQHVTDVAEGLGLRTDEPAIRLGVGEVREWVKQTRLARTPDDIAEAVQRLGLRAADPKAVLIVQALEQEPVTGDATIVLDWVEHFSGDEPRTRRGLRQSDAWDSVLRPQLQTAARTIRQAGYHHVLVRGQMRLPCWFAAGAHLSEVAGFQVTSLQLGMLWSSLDTGHALDQPLIILHDTVAGTGADLAIGIAIATDPTPDIQAYLETIPGVGRYIAISLPPGPGRRMITSSAHATVTAVAIRDLVRQFARQHNAPRLHLFLAVPHGLALLLGHLWDRMPPTLLYEDLGAGNAYQPAFLIPN
jgi:SMODS-associated and fused to various effectors sensor domain